jgi:hypothetical protein
MYWSRKTEVRSRILDFGFRISDLLFRIPQSAITLSSDFQQISFKQFCPVEIYEKFA